MAYIVHVALSIFSKHFFLFVVVVFVFVVVVFLGGGGCFVT